MVATVALLAVLATAGIGSAGSERTHATCGPYAWTNMGNAQAQGVGRSTNCGDNTCFYFDVRLTTSGGVVLAEWNNTAWHACGSHDYPTMLTYCGGRRVHSFFYMNLSGTGKSYTSGDVPC